MLKVYFLFFLLLTSCGEKMTSNSISWLKAKNSKIFDESGAEIQLKGVSSHGLAWYADYYHKNSIKYLVDNWGIKVFRAAMYTEEWGGYIGNRSIVKKVDEIVEAAIELGIYVIIDWHILRDGNPTTHEKEAKEFFDIMSKKYANVPNVIYEICNEPNGYVNWRNSIKGYAERVIPVIKVNSPKALIIVGTATWSQSIEEPADDPLKFDNLAYALHFYSGSHGAWLRERISYALSKGLTIFVSEWGVSQANGSGGTYPESTRDWLSFLDSKKISYVNWSLAPKAETSAILKTSARPDGNWKDEDLSSAGLMVKGFYVKKQD
jgi:endoglucanase